MRPSAFLFTAAVVYLFRGAAAVALEETYSLVADAPCATTLQMYKVFLAPFIEDYQKARTYKKYVSGIEKWQRCCPGSEQNTVKFRPKNLEAEDPRWIHAPAIFEKDAPCGGVIHDYDSEGGKWFREYDNEQEIYWENQYTGIRDNLYSCCLKQFNTCLEQNPRLQKGTAGESVTSERSTFCYKTFSPEYQQQVAEQRAVAEAKERSDTVRQTAEAERAVYCADELDRVRGQCERQVQLAQETDRDEIIRLTMLLSGERDEHEKDLRDSAPWPGIRLFLSFPAADKSVLLVIFGCFAVTAGYFLGWPGRSRRALRVSGSVSALIALGVYVVSVALLSDTRFFELLLAMGAAVMVAALRALVRSQWELRRSGQAPPSP